MICGRCPSTRRSSSSSSPSPRVFPICGAGLARAVADVFEARCDELLHERVAQGAVNREVQRALGHRIAVKLAGELRENRAAELQVAQMILKRGEAGAGLAADAKRGN